MDKILDFKETLQYIKTSRATLYRWATEGTIPAIKMGKHWRFKLSHIDKWLNQNRDSA